MENIPVTVEDQNTQNNRTFSASENVLAWICLLGGYLFCRTFPAFLNPLGSLILMLVLSVLAIIFFKVEKFKIGLYNSLVAILVILISSTMVLNSNEFLNFFIFSFSFVLYTYFVYSVTNNNLSKKFSNLILADFFKALFIMPFASFAKLFVAIFCGNKKGGSKTFLKILIGAGVTLIPTVIISSLLSYDANYKSIMDNLGETFFDEFFERVGAFIFGVPVGMYLFGLHISSVDNKCKTVMNQESCHNFSSKLKILPVVTAVTAMVPPILLYIIFFFSQWQYYMSSFFGVLLEKLTYAEYAREGFFQLCTVASINLVIIIIATIFTKRKTGNVSTAVKIMAVIYSLCTLVLLVTAMSKLVLYINQFGLTAKRVYAAWFMLVIAATFIITVLAMFIKKIPAVATSVAVFAILFLALALPNTDRLIVKYNVDSYLSGQISTFDVNAMADMGYSSVPELVRLKEEVDEKIDINSNIKERILKQDLNTRLNQFANELKDKKTQIYGISIPEFLAKQSLIAAKIIN